MEKREEGVGLIRKGAGVFKGVRRVREGDSEAVGGGVVRELAARRRRRRAARPSVRTAGRLKKRLTVGPGVAVREEERVRRSVGRFGPSDLGAEFGPSDRGRLAWSWAGARDGGPGGCGRKETGRLREKRKKRWRERIRPRAKSTQRLM